MFSGHPIIVASEKSRQLGLKVEKEREQWLRRLSDQEAGDSAGAGVELARGHGGHRKGRN